MAYLAGWLSFSLIHHPSFVYMAHSVYSVRFGWMGEYIVLSVRVCVCVLFFLELSKQSSSS